MSQYSGNDDSCPVCGLKYRRLRTDMDYQQVHDLLKDSSDDPDDWTYKRRNTVLGKWHQIKKELWALHLYECSMQQAFEFSKVPPDDAGDAWEPPEPAEPSSDDGVPF